MNEKDELTYDEEVAMALRTMSQQHEENLRVGREWQRRQQRIIIIKDGNRDDH